MKWDEDDEFAEEDEEVIPEVVEEVETNQINVAIIGRVNVGKSSFTQRPCRKTKSCR